VAKVERRAQATIREQLRTPCDAERAVIAHNREMGRQERENPTQEADPKLVALHVSDSAATPRETGLWSRI